jgi:hypothetical protein
MIAYKEKFFRFCCSLKMTTAISAILNQLKKLSLIPRIEKTEFPHYLFAIYWWPSAHTTFVKPFWGVYSMEMKDIAKHAMIRMSWLIEADAYDQETERIVVCEVLPAFDELLDNETEVE